MDPELFDVENLTPGREEIEAQQLCAGCTVKPECAGDALRPASVSSVIGLLGHVDPEPEDRVPVLGMVRAATVMWLPEG